MGALITAAINKYQDVDESESYCGFLVWFLTDSCYISKLSSTLIGKCFVTNEHAQMSNKR